MLQATSSFTLPALLSPLQVLVVWKHWRSDGAMFVTDRTATKVLFGNAAGTILLSNNGWSVIMPAFSFSRVSTSTKVPNSNLPSSRKTSKPLQLH